MFGTFQPEGVQADYGITKPVNSYNPITLNFHEWMDIVKDVRRSRSFKEAYAMLFTSPGKLESVKESYRKLYEEQKPDLKNVNAA